MQLSAEPIRTVQKPESVSNTGECDVRILVGNYIVKMHLPRPWTKIKCDEKINKYKEHDCGDEF